ncbi:MAG: hypothetical protein HQ547_06140 [Candidatus Omnitrophica bacterium]|nr:hypothetical protein [Candidatus Omnitrophota bacterium]
MIKIELSLAISLYLIFSVIGILLLWVFFERKRGFGGINPEEKFIWQCHICTFFYIDSQSDEISICPRCGTYNSRKQEKKGGGEA